jgi:hypothetical protein
MVPAVLAAPAHDVPDNVLDVGGVNVDPPTLVTFGVQLLITGDDNFNASVCTKFRVHGTTTWHDAQALFRVHPLSHPTRSRAEARTGSTRSPRRSKAASPCNSRSAPA